MLHRRSMLRIIDVPTSMQQCNYLVFTLKAEKQNVHSLLPYALAKNENI